MHQNFIRLFPARVRQTKNSIMSFADPPSGTLIALANEARLPPHIAKVAICAPMSRTTIRVAIARASVNGRWKIDFQVAARPLSLREKIRHPHIFAAIMTDSSLIDMIVEAGDPSRLPTILIYENIPRLPRGSNNQVREVVRRINTARAVLNKVISIASLKRIL